jgi:hypothetical protein
VNTDARYDRRVPDRTTQVPDPPPTEAALSALAHHRDPSLTQRSGNRQTSTGARSLEWVRPSELATSVTTPMLQRGADLQAELARHARHVPLTGARAGRRVTRSAIARPDPSAPSREGLRL